MTDHICAFPVVSGDGDEGELRVRAAEVFKLTYSLGRVRLTLRGSWEAHLLACDIQTAQEIWDGVIPDESSNN